MPAPRLLPILLGLLLPPFLAGASSAQPVKLASLEWPPYAGDALQGRGASTAVVEAAMAAAGLELSVQFLPFRRAVNTGLSEPGFSGYFPEYRAASIRARCAWSAAIGSSPVGFAKRRDSTFRWERLEDLRAYRIGIVGGYVNDGGALDAGLASGEFTGDESTNDLTNLRKLAAGRVDAAIIDTHVFHYLAKQEPALAADLVLDGRLLTTHSLHVCFAPSSDGLALRDRFNAALATINVDQMQMAAMAHQMTP